MDPVSLMFPLFFIVVFVLASYWVSTMSEDAVRKELLRFNIEPIEIRAQLLQFNRHSRRRSVEFTGKSKLTGETVSGTAIKDGQHIALSFDGYVDRRAHLTGDADAAARGPGIVEEELDLEGKIRLETARRLDALQADRDRFLEHDADGDGMVDSEEWSVVRARVEAEVRAELSGTDGTSAPLEDPPADEGAAEAARTTEAAEQVAVVEEEEGYW